MRELSGICPVLPVPFLPDCEIDFASLDRIAGFALESGATGLAILGLASECWKLTERERDCLIRAMVRRAGPVPVVAGVSAESCQAAAYQARQAAAAGASILMATPPLCFRLGDHAILDYYRAISEACGLPIMLQDTSSVGVNQMSVPLLAQLAEEVPRVQYAKVETAPAGPKITALQQRTRLALFSGNGALNILDALERGVSGVMPGVDLVDRMVRIWRFFRKGRPELAAAEHRRILPLLALECQSTETFVALTKRVLYLRRLVATPLVRPPASYVVDEIAATQIAALTDELEQE